MNSNSIIRRLVLLSTACVGILTSTAKAEYQNALALFYNEYFESTLLPVAHRQKALATYQSTVGSNIYLAYGLFLSGEGDAKIAEQSLYDSYGFYSNAQSWLAFYNGNIPLTTYHVSVSQEWFSYAEAQRNAWIAYYFGYTDPVTTSRVDGLVDYYFSIFDYQLSIGTAY
jgi:hypothetical protein